MFSKWSVLGFVLWTLHFIMQKTLLFRNKHHTLCPFLQVRKLKAGVIKYLPIGPIKRGRICFQNWSAWFQGPFYNPNSKELHIIYAIKYFLKWNIVRQIRCSSNKLPSTLWNRSFKIQLICTFLNFFKYVLFRPPKFAKKIYRVNSVLCNRCCNT